MDEPESTDPTNGHILKPSTRQRVLRRLDGLVSAGRVTEAEAVRLRGADEPSAFDAVVREIRARHAQGTTGREHSAER